MRREIGEAVPAVIAGACTRPPSGGRKAAGSGWSVGVWAPVLSGLDGCRRCGNASQSGLPEVLRPRPRANAGLAEALRRSTRGSSTPPIRAASWSQAATGTVRSATSGPGARISVACYAIQFASAFLACRPPNPNDVVQRLRIARKSGRQTVGTRGQHNSERVDGMHRHRWSAWSGLRKLRSPDRDPSGRGFRLSEGNCSYSLSRQVRLPL
jgi:hypothetical protein